MMRHHHLLPYIDMPLHFASVTSPMVSIRHRHEQKEITLHYNPVMKRFFIVKPAERESVQLI